MREKIALLFPGQGAQYPGMGRDFAQEHRAARETFEEADDILGTSLSQLIFEGPSEALTETRNSQVAIYVTSIAMLRALRQLFPLAEPYVCAGLSLGEYTGLTAAGRISFQDCLPTVRERAEAMQVACKEKQGTMAVVMGMGADEVERTVQELQLPQDLWVANFNCPGQVVISGTLRGIEKGSAALMQKGAKRVIPLQVSGAFHSGLMQSAEDRLAKVLSALPLQKSSIRNVMNVPGDFVSDDAHTRQYLIQQVTRSVRWEQGVRAMVRDGITLYLEIGPGKTLAAMNKRMGVTAPTISVEKTEDLKRCDEFFLMMHE